MVSVSSFGRTDKRTVHYGFDILQDSLSTREWAERETEGCNETTTHRAGSGINRQFWRSRMRLVVSDFHVTEVIDESPHLVSKPYITSRLPVIQLSNVNSMLIQTAIAARRSCWSGLAGAVDKSKAGFFG
jgi:hypothetical protein